MKLQKSYKWLYFTLAYKNWHIVYKFDSHIVFFNKWVVDFWAIPTKRNYAKGIKRYINWSFTKSPFKS